LAASPKKPKAGKKGTGDSNRVPDEFLSQLQALYEMAGSLSPDASEPMTIPDLIDAILGDGSGSDEELDFDEFGDLEDLLSELEEGLTELRIAASGGDRDARREGDDLRRWFAGRLEAGGFGSSSLIAVLHSRRRLHASSSRRARHSSMRPISTINCRASPTMPEVTLMCCSNPSSNSPGS
jgi:hypothetical protein